MKRKWKEILINTNADRSSEAKLINKIKMKRR